MESRSKTIQATLVLFGTFGIIVPIAVLLLPSMGKFPPPTPLIPQNEIIQITRPPKSQLSLYVAGINELATVEKNKLKTLQQKRLVAVLEPWLKRPTMNDTQAKIINKSLASILTHDQRLQINTWMSSYSGYGPRIYSNDAQGRAIQAFRQTYNPFYPLEKHRLFLRLPRDMRDRYQVRYNERLKFLHQCRASH